jgi:hypothetical protein
MKQNQKLRLGVQEKREGRTTATTEDKSRGSI